MLVSHTNQDFIPDPENEIPTVFNRVDELRTKLENRIARSQANLAHSYELLTHANSAKNLSILKP